VAHTSDKRNATNFQNDDPDRFVFGIRNVIQIALNSQDRMPGIDIRLYGTIAIHPENFLEIRP